MTQNLGQLTDMWMVNPSMFDPTQASNQYSNYNGSALPWPPTYNTGAAGGPVNAATGQPIPSFQQWQQANPAGMSINSTPAQPQAAAPSSSGPPLGSPASGLYQQGYGDWSQLDPLLGRSSIPGQTAQQSPQAAAQAAPQANAAPNNWQAALNALANPGRVATPGATVPMVTGSQPAGGVNAAFLQNAGGGAGMNQNFLGALRAIQNR
jgi:hypothetical protein